ncbi:spore germination protein [Paenibacillus cymbidii]|uniref:spore germination protein n=1 Tax=Paenibacillus cymbidii TaxID=1639034 RepID=UPI001081DDB3|nr:spore germination protein [Paenibacillus cymbidii]
MRKSWVSLLLKRRAASGATNGQRPGEDGTPIPLATGLADNIAAVRQLLHEPVDLTIREFAIGGEGYSAAIAYLGGLADRRTLNDEALRPLQRLYRNRQLPPLAALLDDIEDSGLGAVEIARSVTLDETLESLLSGDAALFVDGLDTALLIGSRGWEKRSVEEPPTESLIRGPRIGFTEDLSTNTAFIRRRIRDRHLRFVPFRLGRRSRKDTLLVYIDGIANPELVRETERRLGTIDIDDVASSGDVEQWITDSFLSPFPLLLNTERPDKVTGALMQGRLAVLVDGDPFALILPITFASCIQSSEDFYQHWLVSTLTRLLRMVAVFAATFLPSIYIALSEYQQGMIPTRLAYSIAGAREGVPFPAVVEAFIMEGTLELLREAGLRLPKPIGQTIGIVGGLVIGEAAVAAGVVSPIMVIIVAITAMASFSLPSYSFAISLRIVRFAIMLAAGIFGLYGVILAYIVLNIHFANLKSFGIPYSAPFAPLLMRDWKDSVLRAPRLMLKLRPDLVQPQDKDRQQK